MNGLSKGVSTRSMTYDDIASELGLKPASARQLVRRSGWRRVPGNDGRTRVEVPFEEFERHLKSPVESPVDAGQSCDDTPTESPFEAPLVTALTGHIERLERALADAETALSGVTDQRDEARDRAAVAREEVLIARGQIDVLRLQLEQSRVSAASQRADEAAADRDRWHEVATRPEPKRRWWQRLAG